MMSGTFAVALLPFTIQSILLITVILINTLVVSVTIADKKLHTIPNIGTKIINTVNAKYHCRMAVFLTTAVLRLTKSFVNSFGGNDC